MTSNRRSPPSGVTELRARGIAQTLHAPPDLRAWQQEALGLWVAGGSRGIVAAATGTGKTRLALAAIAAFFQPRDRVVIVVPSIALQDQWVRELRSGFGLVPAQIGRVGGGQESHAEVHAIVVAVINSTRGGMAALIDYWRNENRRVLLVVDECHWAGAGLNANILDAATDATLGLSATPERSDDGLEDVLIPSLGPVIYRYPLRQALDDGLLAPLLCLDLYVEPTSGEQASYDVLAKRIRLMHNEVRNQPRPAAALDRLLAKRRKLLSEMGAREAALADAVDGGLLDGKRAIIFHERIQKADGTMELLRDRGIRAVLDSTKRTAAQRAIALDSFRNGASPVLVAVRTVDEGIDVPKADLAIITAGTSTPRQRIQRMGRVVRPSGGEARCISFLAAGTTEESEIGCGDSFLVGPERVRHHRWPAQSVAEAWDAPTSTYQPSLKFI